VGGFLSVIIDHDAMHKYTEKIVCCFGCGWKGEIWEKFLIFQGKAATRIVSS
jgi:hypothetical protein